MISRTCNSPLFLISLALLALCCRFEVSIASAEEERESPGSTVQFGALELDLEEKKKNPYREAQDAAISYFENLSTQMSQLSAGSSLRAAEISDDVLHHLSGVYLYCAVNSGTCPVVLDAVLEVDVINSRIDGKSACPNMKRFWKRWVKNGLEERHKYMVKTSFINEHTRFNSSERPKYLKCEETVQAVIQGVPSNQTFFRDRYRSGSPQSTLSSRMVELLTKVKEKVPNVFIAMGAAGN